MMTLPSLYSAFMAQPQGQTLTTTKLGIFCVWVTFSLLLCASFRHLKRTLKQNIEKVTFHFIFPDTSAITCAITSTTSIIWANHV